MNIVVWLLLMGELIGWAASIFMGTSNRQGVLPNVGANLSRSRHA
ncbi:MAG TPA: hypothetical protein VGC50_07225 [Gammaproteobacteria bacterium]|jgi:uncharacterized membrane protein YeaQ/YmgE (transglycosylase-associated protein family)